MTFRSLRKRKVRTALTVSGIVVGVAMILVLLSLASGFNTQARGLVQAIGGADLTVVNGTSSHAGGFGGGFGGGFFGGGGNTLNQSLVSTVSGISGISTVSPIVTGGADLDGSQQLFLTGIDPTTYSTVTGGLNIVSGSSLNGGLDQIVLGKTVANNLNITVGQNVTLSTSTSSGGQFSVVGIFQTGGFGDNGAYVTLGEAQALLGKTGEVSQILVKLDDPNQATQVSDSITSAIPIVSVIDPQNFLQSRSQLLNSLTTFYTVIGLVALLGGSFGVVNTMMISVSERTREIGTLKAMGARNSKILKIFLGEAFTIGLIGGGVGILIGAAASYFIPSLTGATFRAGVGAAASVSITPSLSLFNLVLSFSLGTVVGVLAGLYPAWRAARMNPVEALRHV
jgi:putative ABC transport system permease protein